jgi:hypothetical protein
MDNENEGAADNEYEGMNPLATRDGPPGLGGRWATMIYEYDNEYRNENEGASG